MEAYRQKCPEEFLFSSSRVMQRLLKYKGKNIYVLECFRRSFPQIWHKPHWMTSNLKIPHSLLSWSHRDLVSKIYFDQCQKKWWLLVSHFKKKKKTHIVFNKYFFIQQQTAASLDYEYSWQNNIKGELFQENRQKKVTNSEWAGVDSKPQSAKQKQPPRCDVFFRIHHFDWNCFSASSYLKKGTKPLTEKNPHGLLYFIAFKMSN